ncbi:hypothetical protein BC833DRAFT_619530 [Globomyces pollinis-pini]|nr:hypothetical protein BC833DRAFT_619530 [Globomyces pollinis-pini]
MSDDKKQKVDELANKRKAEALSPIATDKPASPTKSKQDLVKSPAKSPNKVNGDNVVKSPKSPVKAPTSPVKAASPTKPASPVKAAPTKPASPVKATAPKSPVKSKAEDDDEDVQPVKKQKKSHKEIKKKSKKSKDDDDESGFEDDPEDADDVSFLDTSNIIPTGRRTRGKRVDYTAFGPDDDSD